MREKIAASESVNKGSPRHTNSFSYKYGTVTNTNTNTELLVHVWEEKEESWLGKVLMKVPLPRPHRHGGCGG